MQIPCRPFLVFLWLVGSIAWIGFPAAARAASRGDAFLGYSRLGKDAFYPNVGGLNGWQGALQIKIKPLVGIEGDVAQYGLGADPSIPRTTTFLFGPRLTAGIARVTVFAHALIGGEHSASQNGISGGAMAWAFGGGVDLPVAPFFAWRFAADYLTAPTLSPGAATHGRFSTGLVFRF
jgi:hypothetical protein